MSVANLTDEQLLRRASHAGRNLSVLALLASFGAVALWAFVILARRGPWFLGVPATALSFIAAGYWILAVAGRRGNPHSVAVVIVIFVLQFVITLLSAGIAAAQAGTDFSSSVNVVQLAVPILVLIALEGSRRVLLELQERGLWVQAFASARRSQSLCIMGGIALALGFITLNAGMGYANTKIQQVRAAERQEAVQFVRMVQQEEKDFMTAAGTVLKTNNRAGLGGALAKAAALEARLTSLQAETQDGRMRPVLATYGNAVRLWKNAFLLLKEPLPDIQRAREMLLLGDKQRAAAIRDFERQFGRRSGSNSENL